MNTSTKLIAWSIFLFLAFQTTVFAQKDTYLALSAGADIRNAIVGSKPTDNKAALDYILQFNLVSQNIDLSLGYENFKEIKFDRAFVGLGYHFPLYAYISGNEIKTTLIPSIEANNITRTYVDQYTYKGVQYTENAKASFFTMGLNLAFNWDLSKNVAVQLNTNVLPRPDIKFLYNENKIILSNYFKIVYKFNHNENSRPRTSGGKARALAAIRAHDKRLILKE